VAGRNSIDRLSRGHLSALPYVALNCKARGPVMQKERASPALSFEIPLATVINCDVLSAASFPNLVAPLGSLPGYGRVYSVVIRELEATVFWLAVGDTPRQVYTDHMHNIFVHFL